MVSTLCDPPCAFNFHCREGHRTRTGKYVSPKCVPIKKKPNPSDNLKIKIKQPLETGSLKKLFGGKMQYDAKSCRMAGIRAKKENIAFKQFNGKFLYLQAIHKKGNPTYAKKVRKCRLEAVKGYRGLK